MIPSTVTDYIRSKKEYVGKDLTLLTFPIWSYMRFVAALAAGPPVVGTIPANALVAFSYGIGQLMTAAGQPAVNATQADTNLQNAGQTRDQADVFVYGLSAELDPRSDADFVPDVFMETDVQISTNANTQIPLGKLAMFPQPGGLFGSGRTSMLEPSIDNAGGVDGGAGVIIPYQSNGNPTSGSFYRLDAPIFWAGLGTGPDSNLNLTCTPRRAIAKTAGLVRAAGAAGATYNGAPSPFTPPSAAGSMFVGITWRLHAVSVQVRGVNS